MVSCQNSPPEQRQEPTVGFYHWQQEWDTASAQHCLLQAYPQSPLYLKVFDVVWANSRPEPRAQISLVAKSLPASLVAVVFITNEVFTSARAQQRETLANELLEELKLRLQAHPYQELQIDCDWTTSSRAAYFDFLRQLKARLPVATALTATVRLHQFRRPAEQGLPPVDRGLLMAYNLGDLNQWESKNTILDTLISAQYLQPQPIAYPLPLDVALPYYEWGCSTARASSPC
ncbi:MAG: hypothetical protein HC821_01970 [Lewinella sp.]|nr:hypothetical protein [Lewinella sp.]